MPFYRFKCAKCDYEEQKLLPKFRADVYEGKCPDCHIVLSSVFGIPTARSLETVDDYKNKKIVQGVSKLIDERAKEHFKKHDLPRIIADQGIEFAKRQGFVDEDGKAK